MASLIFTDPGEAVISFCSSSLIYPRPFLFTASWCPLVCFLVSKVFSLMQDLVVSLETWLAFCTLNLRSATLAVLSVLQPFSEAWPHADIAQTVVLLKCTGNEQCVLPLMSTPRDCSRYMCALFNDGLYHIHIHLGAQFLEAELHASSQHLVFDLVAGQVMSPNVMFVRPVEKVSVAHYIL